MATDLERLVVQLSADIKGYENSLRRAQGITTRQTRQIESAFARANRKIQAGFVGLGKGFIGAFAGTAAITAASKLIDASTRISNALKVAGLSGDQLSQVYDRLFASAQRNAAPLETLVQLYSRAATVQRELGVSTEELLTFTDNVALALRVAGTDAQSASGALLQLSQALGSGTVRAEEFNSILEGALPIAQAAAAGLEEAGGSVAKLRQLVVDGKVSSEAFFRAFEAGSVTLQQKVADSELTISQSFTTLTNALIKAAGEFDNATGSSAAFASGITSLASAIDSFDMSGFIGEIQRAKASLDSFLGGLGNSDVFKYLAGAAGVSNVALPSDPKVAGGKGGRLSISPSGVSGTGSLDHLLTSGYPTVSLADFAPPGSSGGGGSAKAVKDTFDAARTGFADMIGYTEEYRRQQELANDQLDQFGNIAQNAGSALANALSDGKLEAGELLQILGQVASQLVQMSLAGGGIGGGFLSGILGSIFHQGGVVGSGGPKRSVHPAVFAGAPRYHSGGVAGLKPGEVPAILQRGEVVLPKGVGARQVAPQNIVITLVGEEGEMFTPRVQQISGQTAGIVVRESRPQLSRDAVNAVQQASRNRPGIFR